MSLSMIAYVNHNILYKPFPSFVFHFKKLMVFNIHLWCKNYASSQNKDGISLLL